MKKHLVKLLTAAFVMIQLFPNVVWACEKCFGAAGATNSPVTDGIGYAMLGLLLITFFIFGLFIALFVYMGRRASKLSSGDYTVNEQGVLVAISRNVIDKT